MKAFLLRIFKRENLVVLVLVVTAVLSVFEIPQHFGINETKVVLIMLGFLAIDSLVEKIGYMDEIETRVKHIEAIVAVNPNSIVLQSRRSLNFSELIKGVNNVFVCATSANHLVPTEFTNIENALKRGVNFRFVLVSPKNPSLQAAPRSSPSSTGSDLQSRWIEDTIEMLKKLSNINTKGKLELRLFDGIPTMSLNAYDIDRYDGYIQVEPHVYKKSPTDRPLFLLQIRNKSEWCEYYRKVVKDIWEDSSEYSLK